MKTNGRYDTAGTIENQYETGSGNSVLKNLRGISTVAEMNLAETLALIRTIDEMVDRYFAAVRSGAVLNYEPMTEVFCKIIAQSRTEG